jgi:hypothetical protein
VRRCAIAGALRFHCKRAEHSRGRTIVKWRVPNRLVNGILCRSIESVF